MLKTKDIHYCIKLIIVERHFSDISNHVVVFDGGEIFTNADRRHLRAPVDQGQICARWVIF